jgi:hypothetical protein
MGYLPVVKIKKFLRIRVPHAKKPPRTKNQPNWKIFWKIEIFTPKRDQGVKNRIFKKFSNFVDFLFWGFFGMANSNPKEFFDFDHGKVPHTRLKSQKGGFYLVWGTSL